VLSSTLFKSYHFTALKAAIIVTDISSRKSRLYSFLNKKYILSIKNIFKQTNLIVNYDSYIWNSFYTCFVFVGLHLYLLAPQLKVVYL